MSVLTDICNDFSALLDSTYPQDLDKEAATWRRIAKLSEEVGEVIEARLGSLGENPRKGRTSTVHDVYRELLDVAFCALAAGAHLNDNGGDVVGDLEDHAAETYARLVAALGGV